MQPLPLMNVGTRSTKSLPGKHNRAAVFCIFQQTISSDSFSSGEAAEIRSSAATCTIQLVPENGSGFGVFPFELREFTIRLPS